MDFLNDSSDALFGDDSNNNINPNMSGGENEPFSNLMNDNVYGAESSNSNMNNNNTINPMMQQSNSPANFMSNIEQNNSVQNMNNIGRNSMTPSYEFNGGNKFNEMPLSPQAILSQKSLSSGTNLNSQMNSRNVNNMNTNVDPQHTGSNYSMSPHDMFSPGGNSNQQFLDMNNNNNNNNMGGNSIDINPAAVMSPNSNSMQHNPSINSNKNMSSSPQQILSNSNSQIFNTMGQNIQYNKSISRNSVAGSQSPNTPGMNNFNANPKENNNTNIAQPMRSNEVFADRAAVFAALQNRQQQQQKQQSQMQHSMQVSPQQQFQQQQRQIQINQQQNNFQAVQRASMPSSRQTSNENQNQNTPAQMSNNNNNAQIPTNSSNTPTSGVNPAQAFLQQLSPEIQQRISAELNSKQYELFMKSLIENCKRNNILLQRIPEIENHKINLFILFMFVQKLGGSENVSNNQQWTAICQKLQVSDTQRLIAIYYKYLAPYEKYLKSPNGLKESKAKKLFLQNLFQEVLRKYQVFNGQNNSQTDLINTNNNNNNNNDSSLNLQNQNRVPQQMPMQQKSFQQGQQIQRPPSTSQIQNPQQQMAFQNQQQQLQQQIQQQVDASMQSSKSKSKANAIKKPRKPKPKKKSKKELENLQNMNSPQMPPQLTVEDQKRLMQEKLRSQQELLKMRYEQEYAKLPKTYERTTIKNYKPINRPVHNISGYDLNYVSQIGEKLEGVKPIFLFVPELGTINLRALSIALESSNLSEVNTALNTLLIVTSDSKLDIKLNKNRFLLNVLSILGIEVIEQISKGVSSFNDRKMNTKHCDEYDVDSMLNDNFTSYGKTNDRINSIFENYMKNTGQDKDKNENLKIKVDSLTGIDIEQVPLMITPEQSPMGKLEHVFKDDDEDGMDYPVKGEEEEIKKVTNDLKLLPESPINNYNINANLDKLKDNLKTPSYLSTLRLIREEIESPFSKVNTRGAEDYLVMLVDQLCMISTILRNLSFSEENSIIISKNKYYKRFLSDLLWILIINDEGIKFLRKKFNLKKDTIITLSNITHEFSIDSNIDCFLIMMLILSFGEPKSDKIENNKNDALTYYEYPLEYGKYQNFGIDVFAKLLSLRRPNCEYINKILFSSKEDEEDNKKENIDERSNKDNNNEGILRILLKIYNDGNKDKILIDIISFLISAIPFIQVNNTPSIIESSSPLISQSLLCLTTIMSSMNNNNKDNNEITTTNSNNNLPLRWLKSEENIGFNLRRLSDALNKISIHTDNNLKSLKVIFGNISSQCLNLLNLLIEKSIEFNTIEDNKIYIELGSVMGLLPNVSQCIDVISNKMNSKEIVSETWRIYELRERIVGHIFDDTEEEEELQEKLENTSDQEDEDKDKDESEKSIDNKVEQEEDEDSINKDKEESNNDNEGNLVSVEQEIPV